MTKKRSAEVRRDRAVQIDQARKRLERMQQPAGHPFHVIEEMRRLRDPQPGQWFWVRGEDDEENDEAVDEEELGEEEGEDLEDEDASAWKFPTCEEDEEEDLDEDEEDSAAIKSWLGCVMHRGSNYVKIEGMDRDGYKKSVRVHIDQFSTRCTVEDSAEMYIQRQIERYQDSTRALMGDVEEMTRYLHATQGGQQTSATQALSTLQVDPNEHKKALVRARDVQLPELFKKIEDSNTLLSKWMMMKTMPLRAQVGDQREIIQGLDRQIFHVELYAGLIENVVKVKRGKAAPPDTKLHLLQRRHYMDEECLLDYDAGGMDFEKLKDFDKWLRKKKNFERIFPFPRCMVAFRIRRNRKHREGADLLDFIRIGFEEKEDQRTFLYVRNGAQLFRLETGVEFEEKLFPDQDKVEFHGQLWMHTNSLRLIDQNRYDEMGEHYRRDMKVWRGHVKTAEASKDPQYRKDVRAWGKQYATEWFCRRNDLKPYEKPVDQQGSYIRFNQENTVYYDDALKKVNRAIEDHNRIALLLQGLYDRSEVLHPHPKVMLWQQHSFDRAVELVYDVDRALEPAEAPPDFEAYRQKLAESIQKGSVTMGQQPLWLEEEQDKQYRLSYQALRYWTPPGNPGPGHLARVFRFQKKAGKCVFRWMRERLTYDPYKDQSAEVPARFVCSVDKLFNVSAYTPGDYLRFYKDYRTRAKYLEWAPFLLTAEAFHAGKIKVSDED